jgi:hypothetical protein
MDCASFLIPLEPGTAVITPRGFGAGWTRPLQRPCHALFKARESGVDAALEAVFKRLPAPPQR